MTFVFKSMSIKTRCVDLFAHSLMKPLAQGTIFNGHCISYALAAGPEFLIAFQAEDFTRT